ncbi:MAG: insulinase family protein [Paracoccaceae bacterium]
MIRLLAALMFLFGLAACTEDGPAVSEETSPEGIKYTLMQIPDHEDVSIQVAWASDWGYREDANAAAPVIGTQLMLAGGADGHAPGEVGERFVDLGSAGNFYVSANDHVVGELTFERGTLDETVAIASAHLRTPTLDQTWFERIREGIDQDMAQARAQPAHAGFDVGRWSVFGAQPLRRALSLDDPAVFQSLTRDEVAGWHQETITRNPAAIVVAGGIDAKTAGTAIDTLLADLPDIEPPVAPDVEPDYSPKRILLHSPDAKVTTLSFIAPLPSTRLGNELEDLIAVHALGGDDQSALFNAVRTELRASYGFGAGIANYTREHRILFIAGEVETAKLGAAETTVRDVYASFRSSPINGDLGARKAPLEASFSTLPDYVIDLARSELQSSLDGFAPGRSLGLVDELKAVSDQSISDRLQNGFPTAEDFIVIAVSPDADALPGACVITTTEQATACK